MTKRPNLSVKSVVIALLIGLYFAATFTNIKKPCETAPLGEDVTKCVEFADATMYPGDLLRNEQNSLVRFLSTFAITSISAFALLSIVTHLKKRQ